MVLALAIFRVPERDPGQKAQLSVDRPHLLDNAITARTLPCYGIKHQVNRRSLYAFGDSIVLSEAVHATWRERCGLAIFCTYAPSFVTAAIFSLL